MPRTGFRSDGGLEISISNIKAFHPGDRIEGRVVLKAGFNPPNAVQLEFSGRAKTKFLLEVGKYKTICRGRAPLLREQLTLTELQYAAEDAEKGTASWSFSLPIPPNVLQLPKDPTRKPTNTNPVESGGEYQGPNLLSKEDYDWPQHRSFLSNLDDLEMRTLPSVFYYRENLPGKDTKTEAYIEYTLSATAVNPGDKRGTWTATFPLLLRTPSAEQPIEDFGLSVFAYRFSMQSSQLAQQVSTQDGKKSFGKGLTKLFGSSAQKYAFRVYLQSPRVIQLNHPEHLAFKVWMMPILHPEFTTVAPAYAPPVTVTSVSVVLKAIYRLRAPFTYTGMKFESNMQVCNCTNNFALTPTITLAEPITLPPLWDTTAGPSPAKPATTGPHANQPPGFRNAVNITPPPGAGMADLGAVLGIAVQPNKATFNETATTTASGVRAKWPRNLSPSFSTYNVAVEYKLLTTLEISCAGKTFKLPHEGSVGVMAPSEVQMRAVEEALGTEGMKKNYDDFRLGLESGLNAAHGVLSALGSFGLI